MSAEQMELSTMANDFDGEPPLVRVRAVGRNACLVHKQGSSALGWTHIQRGGEAEEAVLADGDQLCLLHDQSWRYTVVAAGSVGSGRRLTRSLTE